MRVLATLFVALFLLTAADASAQSWRRIGSMVTERRMHTATLLHDNRVLVTGGSDRYHRAIASCELFDVETLSWSAAPSMATPRERHTATLLTDGRVVIIGGNTLDNMTNRVTAAIEIFDPATGTFSSGGALVTPRQNHTATLLADGRILVTGGFRAYGERFLADCEIYDPATMRSTTVEPLPRARMDHAALLLVDGRVLVVGGRVGGWDGEYLDDATTFDPATGEWRSIDRMNDSRIVGFSLVQFSDSVVLVAGGRSGAEASTAGSELLDARLSAWSAIDAMLLPVTWHAGALMANDRYLVTGGFTDAIWNSSNVVVATPTTEWYDRAARRWYFAPTMNQKRAEHTMIYAVRRTIDEGPRDLVMVAGGIIGNDTITATAEILDVTEAALAQYARNQQSSGTGTLDIDPSAITVIANGTASPRIEAAVTPGEPITAELYDTRGTRAATLHDGSAAGGTLRFALPSGLASGMYLLRLTSGATTHVARVTVVR